MSPAPIAAPRDRSGLHGAIASAMTLEVSAHVAEIAEIGQPVIGQHVADEIADRISSDARSMLEPIGERRREPSACLALVGLVAKGSICLAA